MTDPIPLRSFFPSAEKMPSSHIKEAVRRIGEAMEPHYREPDLRKEFGDFESRLNSTVRREKLSGSPYSSERDYLFYELIADYIEGNILYKESNDYLLNVEKDPINVLYSVDWAIAFLYPKKLNHLGMLEFLAAEGCLLNVAAKITVHCSQKKPEHRVYGDHTDCLERIYSLYHDAVEDSGDTDHRRKESGKSRPYSSLLRLPMEWQLEMAKDTEEE